MRHCAPQRPLDNCPHCCVPVRWALNDGVSSFVCSAENCLIKFEERVWYPFNTINFNFAAGYGVLFYYSFQVGDIRIVMDFGGDGRTDQREIPRLIINPKFKYGDLKDGELIIESPPVIDWSDLKRLEDKFKTLITFS